jgi:HD-GYP domain-containing protein (c-di-GMP phosphodiesterase class II)
MAESNSVFVDVADLRVGMFVYLELGWMSHPFPASSFKIGSDKQLQTIRSLGLTRIRWSAEKSDAPPAAEDLAKDGAVQSAAAAALPQQATDFALQLARRREQLSAQRLSFARCEEKFTQATAVCVQVMGCAGSQPELARDKSQALIGDMVEQMLGQGESMIHLLSDGSGERAALHPVNVSIISLLLGKAMALPAPQLQALGMAALLHDMGKAQLPERVRWRDPSFSAMEDKIHQEHVALSVSAAQRLGLASPILLGIAQHHEMVDGSGFPLGLKGESMTALSRILALVNRYDNLCNPSNASLALTPHEALAQIFAQAKTRFDAASLNAFIRLMGIYPPGSVVQLVDDRFALVLSVNSSRPLRPQVIVHDASVPRDEALILNLEEQPLLGIKRSLKPVHLPQAALNYLSPRKRVSYFFEQAVLQSGEGVAA